MAVHYTHPPQARQDAPLPSNAAGEKQPEAYQHLTPPNPEPAKTGSAHGYVEGALCDE
jgi:hypothetical protein